VLFYVISRGAEAEKYNILTPPPHNRFREPNTYRSLILYSDLQIVGSVTWWAAISEGGGG